MEARSLDALSEFTLTSDFGTNTLIGNSTMHYEYCSKWGLVNWGSLLIKIQMYFPIQLPEYFNGTEDTFFETFDFVKRSQENGFYKCETLPYTNFGLNCTLVEELKWFKGSVFYSTFNCCSVPFYIKVLYTESFPKEWGHSMYSIHLINEKKACFEDGAIKPKRIRTSYIFYLIDKNLNPNIKLYISNKTYAERFLKKIDWDEQIKRYEAVRFNTLAGGD